MKTLKQILEKNLTDIGLWKILTQKEKQTIIKAVKEWLQQNLEELEQ